jgi:16S rRNA (cytidine1402-2'-O)-methyltransferase
MRAWFDVDPNRLKGEFVLIVKGAAANGDADAEDAERVLKLLLAQLPLKQAVQLAADITGAKKNALYQRALELRRMRNGPADDNANWMTGTCTCATVST